jgi:hypothetical protein
VNIFLVLRTGSTCFPYPLFAFCGPWVLEDGSGGRTVSCENCNARPCMKRFVPPAMYSGGPVSNLGQRLDYITGWLGFPQISRADGSVLS